MYSFKQNKIRAFFATMRIVFSARLSLASRRTRIEPITAKKGTVGRNLEKYDNRIKFCVATLSTAGR